MSPESQALAAAATALGGVLTLAVSVLIAWLHHRRRGGRP